MPTDDATPAAAPAAPATTPPPAAAPAAPAWAPKRGELVDLTETEPRTKKVSTELFLITGTSTARGPQRDAKGAVVTETVPLPVGPILDDGKKATKMITRAVLEDVTTFSGIILSAERQFPVPKRGVSIAALSPLED